MRIMVIERIIHGDNAIVMRSLVESHAAGTFHVVCTDPKYNIGIEYGNGINDNLSKDEYLTYCTSWIDPCVKLLHPKYTGSVWDGLAQHGCLVLCLRGKLHGQIFPLPCASSLLCQTGGSVQISRRATVDSFGTPAGVQRQAGQPGRESDARRVD